MDRRLPLTACLLGLVATVRAAEGAPSGPQSVTSPDGRIRVEVFLGNILGPEAIPCYRVSFRGRTVVHPSPLGVKMADGTSLGADSTIESVTSRSFREAYTQFPGKRSRSLDHGSETVIVLRERAAPSRRWEVVVRAYDDGIAFRYRFPAQEGWSRLGGARRADGLPAAPGRRGLRRAAWNPSPRPMRCAIRRSRSPGFPRSGSSALPLLVELPDIGFAAILEAELVDYAATYLVHEDTRTLRRWGPGSSPLPGTTKIAVRAELPHQSPWRVVMIADRLERLVESDLMQNLNPPCAIGDTSWIKPGKTTFPWWNGFYEENVPFKMGLNTETAKYYIDFCAEAGIPYHSLDGLDNVAWYGGPIVPYRGAGITEGIAGLDLREVIRYAKSKGVKLGSG